MQAYIPVHMEAVAIAAASAAFTACGLGASSELVAQAVGAAVRSCGHWAPSGAVAAQDYLSASGVVVASRLEGSQRPSPHVLAAATQPSPPERWGHMGLSPRKLCRIMARSGRCSYGAACRFIHTPPPLAVTHNVTHKGPGCMSRGGTPAVMMCSTPGVPLVCERTKVIEEIKMSMPKLDLLKTEESGHSCPTEPLGIPDDAAVPLVCEPTTVMLIEEIMTMPKPEELTPSARCRPTVLPDDLAYEECRLIHAPPPLAVTHNVTHKGPGGMSRCGSPAVVMCSIPAAPRVCERTKVEVSMPRLDLVKTEPPDDAAVPLVREPTTVMKIEEMKPKSEELTPSARCRTTVPPDDLAYEETLQVIAAAPPRAAAADLASSAGSGVDCKAMDLSSKQPDTALSDLTRAPTVPAKRSGPMPYMSPRKKRVALDRYSAEAGGDSETARQP